MLIQDAQTPSAGLLFRQGRLAEAIEAANDAVRRTPAAAAPRLLLAELLLFEGRLERADAVLDAAARLDSAAALVIAEFRQLLRAATARRQVLLDGRAPEFLGQPTASQAHLLQALVALRLGDAEGAAAASAAAEAARAPAPGGMTQTTFADWRDADDLWAGSFEILTSTGKYFWIPTERVESLEFHPPTRPRDLLWRRCSLSVRDGPEGDVYMPALYGPAFPEPELPPRETLRLGRETEWTGAMPVRGIGQRVFLVGEAGVPIHQLSTVEFA